MASFLRYFGCALLLGCFPDLHVRSEQSEGGASGGSGGSGGTGEQEGPDGEAPPSDARASDTSTSDTSTSDAGKRDAGKRDAGKPDVPEILIPKGAFTFANERGSIQVATSVDHDFYLGTTEVTAARFERWIAAARPVPAHDAALDPRGPYESMKWNANWDANARLEGYKGDAHGCSTYSGSRGVSTTYLADGGDLPANCINWYQAVAFCFWESGSRLPTTVEWDYVATGRGHGYTYPWGDTPAPTCGLATFADSASPCPFPIPVGSSPLGASVDGLLDMSGSLTEWNWDYYWLSIPDPMPADYTGPSTGASRHVRGGSWGDDVDGIRTRVRDSRTPSSSFSSVGFRCARTQI